MLDVSVMIFLSQGLWSVISRFHLSS